MLRALLWYKIWLASAMTVSWEWCWVGRKMAHHCTFINVHPASHLNCCSLKSYMNIYLLVFINISIYELSVTREWCVTLWCSGVVCSIDRYSGCCGEQRLVGVAHNTQVDVGALFYNVYNNKSTGGAQVSLKFCTPVSVHPGKPNH